MTASSPSESSLNTKQPIKKFLAGCLIALVLTMGIIVTGLIPLNLSFARASIEMLSGDLLGMRVDLDGDIRVRLGLTPTLTVEALSIQAPESFASPMIQARELAVSAGLIDLLRGDIHIRQVTLGQGIVNYCADPRAGSISGSGQPKSDSGNPTLPSIAIDTLSAKTITIVCTTNDEADSGTAKFTVIALRASAPAEQPINIVANVRFANIDMQLTATTGVLDDVLDKPESLPLTARVIVAGDSLVVRGRVLTPFERVRVDAAFEIGVADIREWSDVTGLQLRKPAGINLQGRFRASASGFDVTQASGSFAGASLELTSSVRLAAPRPYIEVETRLDQFDLGIFVIDAEESMPTGRTADVDLAPVFDILQTFDGNLALHITRIDGAPLSIADAKLSAELEDGALVVQSLSFSHDRARLVAAGQLDTRIACPALTATASVDDLTTEMLVDIIGVTGISGSFGRIEAQIESCGRSLLAHRDTSRLTGRVAGASVRFNNAISQATIDSLSASSGWQTPAHVELDGSWKGERVSAMVDAGPLATLLRSTFSPLTIEIQAAGVNLKFDGRIRPDSEDFGITGALDLAATRLGTTSAWTDVRADVDTDLSLQTSVHFEDAVFTFDNLLVTVGASDTSGRLLVDISGDRPVGNLRLHSRTLDLVELQNLFSFAKSAAAERSSESKPDFKLSDLRLPRIDYDLSAERIRLARFSMTDVATRGRLRDALIDDATLAMQLDEIDLTGTLDLDLRGPVPVGSFTVGASNVDIGRLMAALDLVDDLDAHAERLDVEYASRGSTPKVFVANSRIQATARHLAWRREEASGSRATHLRLDELSMTAAPDGKTVWRSTGFLNNVAGEFRIETPSLREIFDVDTTLPLKAALLFADDVLLIDATFEREGMRVTGADISASGQSIDPLSVDLEKLAQPLEAYQLEARFRRDDRELTVTDLVARIGESYVEGNASIALTGDQRRIRIELSAPHVQTNDFIGIAASWRERSGPEAGPVSVPQEHQANANDRQLVDVIDDALEELVGNNALDIDIKIGELYSGADRLGTAEARLVANNEELHLNPLRIALPGGNVDAEYHFFQRSDSVDVELRIHAERLVYGGLFQLLSLESDATGLAYLDANLTSSAPDRDSIRSNFAGHLDLIAIPRDIEAGLLDLWAGNVVLAILPVSQDTGHKKLNCLVARLEVEDGIMQSKNVMLDTTDVIVRGRGKIDLGSQRLDLLFAPQAKREKFFSIATPVTVTGPWNDFQVGVNPGGLVATAFRWYLNLIYVPFKWLTGERFPSDGLPTCFKAMDWEVTPEEIIAVREQIEQM